MLYAFLFGLGALLLLALPLKETKPKRKGRVYRVFILDPKECTFDD